MNDSINSSLSSKKGAAAPFDYSIETADFSDLEQILSLQKRCYQKEAQRYNDNTIPPLTQTLKEIQKDFKSALFFKLTETETGKIIGSVKGELIDGTGHLGRLMIAPEYQGRGLAKKLIQHLEKNLLEQGPLTGMELFTGEKSFDNIGLYQSQGYKITRTEFFDQKNKLVYMRKETNITYQKAAAGWAKSYNQAVSEVAEERKYLATATGFPEESSREFVKMIEEHNLAQYYALAGDRVIGWCDIIPKQFEGLNHAGVLGMGLLKGYRGRGIGAKLLKMTIDHAKTVTGLEKVELEVFKSNTAAIQLYKKFGFVIEGERIKSRKLDGQWDNALLMGLMLQ